MLMVHLNIDYNMILMFQFIFVNYQYLYAIAHMIFVQLSYLFLVVLNDLNVLRYKTNHLCLRYLKCKDSICRNYTFFNILKALSKILFFLFHLFILLLFFKDTDILKSQFLFYMKFIFCNIFLNYLNLILIICLTNVVDRQ